jgi:hypothetical protein
MAFRDLRWRGLPPTAVPPFLNPEDATERRITELSTRAVEQLGSGKVAVRLCDLYALEGLAQGDPYHRQTAGDGIRLTQ